MITLNRGEACVHVTTSCLCPRSQENLKFFAPNNKSIVDSNKLFGWKNCLWIILSSLIHGCLIRSEVVLTSTINLHVSVVM